MVHEYMSPQPPCDAADDNPGSNLDEDDEDDELSPPCSRSS